MGTLLGGESKDGIPIEPGLVLKFGNDIPRLTTATESNGDSIIVTATWDSISNPPGVWTQQVRLPQELAETLKVNFDDVTVFSNYESEAVAAPIHLNVSKMSFVSASTGKVVFEIVGKFPRAHMAYNPKTKGDIHVTVFSTENGKTGQLLDMPESRWQITFQQEATAKP